MEKEIIRVKEDVRYIGRTKDRYGNKSAMGLVNGQWTLIFAEHILRAWFNQTDPTSETMLYAVLGLSEVATSDEIKSSYRRLARQWHPDVCKEPNAKDAFTKIKDAYEILSNEDQRKKYDVGLTFQRMARQKASESTNEIGYRSPLRCGILTLEGYMSKRWFIVTKIVKWDDIQQNGKTLVTSWVYGNDTHTENWV